MFNTFDKLEHTYYVNFSHRICFHSNDLYKRIIFTEKEKYE